MSVPLEIAEAILTAARAKALELDRTVSLAVVDPGGYLVAFSRMDGGRWVNVDIAVAKATGAAAFRRDVPHGFTHAAPSFFAQMLVTMKGRVMLDGGSFLIKSADGEILGAVAASGASGEEDDVIVRAGLAAVEGRL
jgi:uncharacterized protein GlcG (DUF336 family)